MDTGKPSILYDGNVNDANPFCHPPHPPTHTHAAQTIQLADQTREKKQLFRAFLFALFVRSEKLM